MGPAGDGRAGRKMDWGRRHGEGTGKITGEIAGAEFSGGGYPGVWPLVAERWGDHLCVGALVV
jgi:hypothetical protein